MKVPAVFATLRHGPFARYMAGEFTSMVGSWMQIFAQQWVITTITKDERIFGLLTFASTVPMMLTLIGGRAADRYEKRKILLSLLAVQCSASLTLGWLIGNNHLAIWHLFVAAIVLGLVNAFEMPAAASIVPELVPREEMPNAIAIDRSSFHLSRLLAPSVGGSLIASFGSAAAYYINAASFLALAAALVSLPKGRRHAEVVPAAMPGEAPLESEPKEAEPPKQSEIAAGLAYVRGDGPTRTMIGLMTSLMCFVSPFIMTTMAIYATHTLGLDSRHMGYLIAVSGLGSLIGSFVLLVIPKGQRALALKLAATAIALSLFGMAQAPALWWAAGPLFLLTMGTAITFGTANIVVQERAPDRMRGRVSSVVSLANFGVLPFSSLAITQAIHSLGMRTALTCGAIGYAALSLVLLWDKERLASAPAEAGEVVGGA